MSLGVVEGLYIMAGVTVVIAWGLLMYAVSLRVWIQITKLRKRLILEEKQLGNARRDGKSYAQIIHEIDEPRLYTPWDKLADYKKGRYEEMANAVINAHEGEDK